MSVPIVYMDRSEVASERLVEVEQRIAELAEMVEESEPGLLSYAVFFDAPKRGMTVIHVHADSASLASHFEIAGPAFERFTGLVELKAIDVYGHPDDDVLERIRSKAALLGEGSVTVHDAHAGFLRASGLTGCSLSHWHDLPIVLAFPRDLSDGCERHIRTEDLARRYPPSQPRHRPGIRPCTRS